jgi:hypothetical protein
VSESDQSEPSEAADDVTVGAWADVDETPDPQPLDSDPPWPDVIFDPAPASPSLWARLMRALRGAR